MGGLDRVVDLDAPLCPEEVAAWIRERRVSILNIAGPRASQSTDIYEKAVSFLQLLLQK